ncbi:hypothetical protein [Pseudidiomarina donghaiensis]|uniref:hypothetical protein n=1 Tax=Pseudidiomarina donghaiensis TaxID=519452 RepID=UPI001F545A7F|nr:hypothetical protein [Pseudidiomarina donghaiensis]
MCRWFESNLGSHFQPRKMHPISTPVAIPFDTIPFDTKDQNLIDVQALERHAQANARLRLPHLATGIAQRLRMIKTHPIPHHQACSLP